ncbi:MAG: PQQ-binding-like beta-propeller repeat protein [Candidatus Saliniplasma sp.]
MRCGEKEKILSISIVVLVFMSMFVVTLKHNSENAVAEADEEHPWASFGGDRRNTRRSPYDTSHVDGTVKWTINKGWSSGGDGMIISDDGVLYTHSSFELMAIQINDGSRIWEHRITEATNFSSSSSPRGSLVPAVGEDGTIYIVTREFTLVAVNPNGTRKWTFEFEESEPPFEWTEDSSPNIGLDGTIYFNLKRKLYAVNPDGTLKWKNDLGGRHSSPVIGEDGMIYKGLDYLFCIYPENGTVKWSLTETYVKYRLGSVNTPAIDDDGTIYFNTFGDGYLVAINPNGTLKWFFEIDESGMRSTPALGHDGTIYVTGNSKIHAINPNGTLKWAYPTGAYWEASPAVGGDGTIYTASSDGFFYAFDPNGTLNWRYDLEDNWAIHSSPVICSNGDVYIETRLWTYAFGDEIQDDSFPIPGFPVITMVAGTVGAIVVYRRKKDKGEF